MAPDRGDRACRPGADDLADVLLKRVRRQARGRGRTLNDRASTVLDAASDPLHAGSVGAQVRERVARARLLDGADEIHTSATNPVIVAAVRFDALAHGWGSARFVPVAVSRELVRDAVACFDRELAEAAVREGFRPLTG